MHGVVPELLDSEPVVVTFARGLRQLMEEVSEELKVPEDFSERLSWRGERATYLRLCGNFLDVAAKLQHDPQLGFDPLADPNLPYVLEMFLKVSAGELPYVAFPAIGALKEAMRSLSSRLENALGDVAFDEDGPPGSDSAGPLIDTEAADIDAVADSLGAPREASLQPYLEGETGIELLPSCVGTESADVYSTWTTALISELMSEFGPMTPSRKILVESIAHAHIDAAIFAGQARRVAHEEAVTDRARIVERYARLADQNRKRAALSIEALRRPVGGDVKVTIGSANVCFGDQVADGRRQPATHPRIGSESDDFES